MLSVEDFEDRERGMVKVNKDKDHFLENSTVPRMWMGTVGRSNGMAGGAQEGGGAGQRKSMAGFHHHEDEKRLGGRGSGEPLKGQRLRCGKDKN